MGKKVTLEKEFDCRLCEFDRYLWKLLHLIWTFKIIFFLPDGFLTGRLFQYRRKTCFLDVHLCRWFSKVST